MSKLDDDEVTTLGSVDQSGETSFVGIASCTSASNCLIYDGDAKVLSKKLTPS